jgi:hypothetical protein
MPQPSTVTSAFPTQTQSPSISPSSTISVDEPNYRSTKPSITPTLPLMLNNSDSIYTRLPNLLNISVSQKSSNSITLAVALDSPSQVNCAALNKNPTTTFDILNANAAVWVKSNTANLTLNSLIPVTNYGIFCLAWSADGQQMTPLKQIIAARINASTLCCKQITVTLSFTSVFCKTTAAQALLLVLDGKPSQSLNIQILSGQRSSPSLFFPSNLTFTTNSNQLFANVAFIGSDIPESIYFEVLLDGPSSGEFNIIMPTKHSIEVIDSNSEPLVPMIILAQFSNDGSMISVVFDSATDMAANTVKNTLFVCSSLFLFDAVVPGLQGLHCVSGLQSLLHRVERQRQDPSK